MKFKYVYALLHCCCKNPATHSWTGMLCANLPFHFDIYVDIVGIYGNILRICCDSTVVFVSSFGPFMTQVEQGLRCKDDIGCSER